jgi:origin recognition complex subunit 5
MLIVVQIPNLTTVFIVTAPRPNFLHFPGAPHIHFPPYTKQELLQILSLTDLSPKLPGGAKETKDVWTHFASAVWDSLAKHSGRDILSMRSVCLRLWPRFIAPIHEGSHSASQFGRLLLANRSLFQSDSVLVPSIITDAPTASILLTPSSQSRKYPGIGTQLPYYSRLLLVAAYLASFNPPRTDQLTFMKAAAARRRKRGGGTALSKGRPGISKHRKISRKLLGPQAFVLERMLAIFHAVKDDGDSRGRSGRGKELTGGAADIEMGIATLVTLRLLAKVGSANSVDTLEGGSKYRVAVGWEVVRGVARSVGVEAEDYLAE